MGGADATLTYYFRNINDMRALLADPEYQKRGHDSETAWIDSSKGQLRVGWEIAYVETANIRYLTFAEEGESKY
jgi:hypothetical protein